MPPGANAIGLADVLRHDSLAVPIEAGPAGGTVSQLPQMRGLHGGATLEIADRHHLPSAPMWERGRYGNDTSRWFQH